MLATPWKIGNEMRRWLSLPYVRLIFAFHGIPWGRGWMLYGAPIIQKHKRGIIRIGDRLQLRSSIRSNPLGPARPVILYVGRENAVLEIGNQFGMSGGSLCAWERIQIGHRVTIGCNSLIIDTDFHPLDAMKRQRASNASCSAIRIDDDVFIGASSIVLKGVHIGCGSVIGAGSVVSNDIPEHCIAAGNPAKRIRDLG
jgi:acyl-[acyl carrier protein]--UDP-N-acetylglucosamine O-acyltransferase